jgi:hypothetical protein
VCPKCHVVERNVLSPDRFTADSDGLCLGCHRREALGRSHPVNVGPTAKSFQRRIPERFRLNVDGRLMCLTCHTAHGPYLSATPSFPGQPQFDPSAGEPRYKTYYLRQSSPDEGFEALCKACHGNV